MTAALKSTTHGQTMVLTISNPEHRNALGPEIYAAGVEALSVAESSAEVRTVVITGEGTTFCAGGNLNRLLGNRQQPPEVQAQSVEGLHTWIEAIRTFPKPVIAAVEGAAENGVEIIQYLATEHGAIVARLHVLQRKRRSVRSRNIHMIDLPLVSQRLAA